MPCTNQVCIEAGLQNTHAWKKCGRKGGPMHEAYIAKKTEEEKAKNDATKNGLLNELYQFLLTILISRDEGGKTGADHYRTLYHFEGRDEQAIAQKVIGMLKDAYGLGELKKIAGNQDRLFQEFIDCATVLDGADEENQQKTEHE